MTTSYNGWPASTDPHAIGITHLDIPGRPNAFPPGVKGGDVATVLGYVAMQVAKRVEPLGEGCWGYSYRKNRNANNLSCHASGTAIDINAPRHPNGKAGTFTAEQVKEIRLILHECGGVVKWGGDFHGTKDEMHFEIHGTAAQVAKAARTLRNIHAASASRPRPAGAPAWWTAPHKLGDVGQEVASIRKRLKLPPGVTFDETVDKAVRYVQHAHGLTVDGVVGAETAKAIG
jgi:murein L,D-transpeptidase YcbB/YkuD